jgi:hypothetical protein
VILSRLKRVAWLLVPTAAAILLSMILDPLAMPFSGNERISAVFLIDGQGYFGHIEDVPWSGTITLRDVYYFTDASKVTSDLQVALVKRGGELHQPIDVMHIRRDKVLLVERVGLDSAVAQAISAQRALDRSVTK